MNCEYCKENLSHYLDGELDTAAIAAIQAHLAVCLECALECEDFAAILDNSSCLSVDDQKPPNPDALWCRINNIIESEIKPPAEEVEPERPRSSWNLSFAQIGAGVLAVTLISSLLTIVAVRNYFEPAGDDYTTRSVATQTPFEKLLARVGLIETPQQARERRFKEQQAVIEYWDNRVRTRRDQWDSRMKEAFDRNLREIDQAVHEYTLMLENDPQDELSGEMLDAALSEKMNLLRQFSEL
jgi:hypothetical protein